MVTVDPRVRAIALPAGVAVVLVAIIGPTLMPGLAFWDTAEFQAVPPILGTMHPTGYPTYVVLGFVVNLLLTPLGEPAFRMNVLSLISVALAASLAAWLIRELTGRSLIAAAVGIGLGLTPVVWAIATRADAHALHLALVTTLIALLVRWERAQSADDPRADRWLVLAAVVYGLAAGNHSLTLLLAPPVGLYVLAVEPRILRRPRLVATCLAVAVGVLALVYLELPLRAGPFRAALVYARPETWDGFWYIALAEQFRGSLGNPFADLPTKLNDLAGFASRQLGPLALAVPLAFLATVARAPRFALLTGSAMLITVLFNAAYSNADLERYYLGPALFAWLWLGLLAATILDQASPPVSEPDQPPPRILGVGLSAVLAIGLLVPTILAFPARAELEDRSPDNSARRWLDAVFQALPPDSVIVSWWSVSTPLWYGQYVEGRRLDVLVVDDRTMLDRGYGEASDVVERFYRSRPVFMIRANAHDLGLVLLRFDLQPLPGDTLHDVYRVVGPRTASP